MQETSSEIIIKDPSMHLHEIDLNKGRAIFIKMTRKSYKNSTFLDDRIIRVNEQQYLTDIESLLKTLSLQNIKCDRFHFIFHSAFSCSTLLANCLHLARFGFSLKEPLVLSQLAMGKRMGEFQLISTKERFQIFKMVLFFLSRSSSFQEAIFVKPSDLCNNLIEDVLSISNSSRALFIYTDLKSFLVSCIKSKNRRNFIRARAKQLSQGVKNLTLLSPLKLSRLTDGQNAAIVWSFHMKTYLNCLRGQVRNQIYSLNCETFLSYPNKTFDALLKHCGISSRRIFIDKINKSGVMNHHAKNKEAKFNPLIRKEENIKLEKKYGVEINETIQWFLEWNKKKPVPQPLPQDLIE